MWLLLCDYILLTRGQMFSLVKRFHLVLMLWSHGTALSLNALSIHFNAEAINAEGYHVTVGLPINCMAL